MKEIKSPNQDPNDFQRLLLVFALTFIAIAASQFFLSKFGPKPPAKPEQTAAQQSGATPPATTPASGAPAIAQQQTKIGAPPLSPVVGDRVGKQGAKKSQTPTVSVIIKQAT